MAPLRLAHVGGLPPGATGHPLLFTPRRPIPVHRFDDPGGIYDVWYGSASADGAFLEVFADSERAFVLPDQRTGRVCGEVEIDDGLQLIDLRAPAVLGILDRPNGLDDQIGTTTLYSVTQAWSRAFFEYRGDIGGLVYRARLAGDRGPSVVLFMPRAAGARDAREAGVSVDDVRFQPQRDLLARVARVAWG
jgi:hypothetical protein